MQGAKKNSRFSKLSSLTPTMEDYMEVVTKLVAKEGVAHVQDIADAAEVHKSTVTTAMQVLAEKGLVNYRPYQPVTLTDEGRKTGERIIERHEAISTFLSEILLINKDLADENACRMEHVLDREVVEQLSVFGRFVKECPRAGRDWLERFRYYRYSMKHSKNPPKDEKALKDWIEQFQKKLKV